MNFRTKSSLMLLRRLALTILGDISLLFRAKDLYAAWGLSWAVLKPGIASDLCDCLRQKC